MITNPATGADGAFEGGGIVYVVSDAGRRLTIKAVPVHKESTKAIYLSERILLPATLQPKQLLVKGVDPIARTEGEALEYYLAAQKKRKSDLRHEIVEIAERIYEAECLMEQKQAEKDS